MRTLDEIMTAERWTNRDMQRHFEMRDSYISEDSITAHRKRRVVPSKAKQKMYLKILNLEETEIDFSVKQ